MAKSRLQQIKDILSEYGGEIDIEDFPSLQTKKGKRRTRFTQDVFEQFLEEWEVFQDSDSMVAEEAIQMFLDMTNWRNYSKTPKLKDIVEDWVNMILRWKNGRKILGQGLLDAGDAGEVQIAQEYAYDYNARIYLGRIMPYIADAAEKYAKFEEYRDLYSKAKEKAKEYDEEDENEGFDSFVNEEDLPEEFLKRF